MPLTNFCKQIIPLIEDSLLDFKVQGENAIASSLSVKKFKLDFSEDLSFASLEAFPSFTPYVLNSNLSIRRAKPFILSIDKELTRFFGRYCKGEWTVEGMLEYQRESDTDYYDSCDPLGYGEEENLAFSSLVISDPGLIEGVYRIIIQFLFVPDDPENDPVFIFKEVGKIRVFNGALLQN